MSGSGTSTSSGTGLGIVVLVVVLIIGAVVVAQRQPPDTDTPPDPFEGEEPRVVDCVGDWQSPRDPIITADIYCEVGGEGNSFDAQSVERHPYVWSTTGYPGQLAVIYMVTSRQTVGLCEIWVDGELLESEPLVEITDEGQGPDGSDVLYWSCAMEVAVP